MGFWIFMCCMCLLIPAGMLGWGKYFMSHVPKNIGMLFGYRTSMSMKNGDTWAFAHQYYGRVSYRLGWIGILAAVVGMALAFGRDVDTVGIIGGVVVFAQLILLVGTIVPTERALRKNFDANGNRRG